MGASNQTDAERRLLRQCQRDLHNRIAVGRGGEYAAGNLDCWHARNNELWRHVLFPREAVLDSVNADIIARGAARLAEKSCR